MALTQVQPGMLTGNNPAVPTSTAVGTQALNSNSGANNTAVGYQSIYSNTTGTANTAIGLQALYANTTASSNTAVGFQAAVLNTTGASNTAVGESALRSNTTASQNTAIGYQALYSNTGPYNVAIGYRALYSNTGGDNNVAIGRNAMYLNTGGTNNIAIGNSAGYYLAGGVNNTIVGDSAGGVSGTTFSGGNNTCHGTASGQSLTTGNDNTFVGYNAGIFTTTAGGQTVIGSQCTAFNATSAFGVVIGYAASGVAAGDYVTIGRNAAGRVYNQYSVNATWTQTSDGRLKKNIVEDDLGLSFINRLRPVKYEWKASNELDTDNPLYSEENQRATGITMHGLIAQEVKEALDAEGCTTFSGWDVTPDGTQGISREMFISPLIKAIQELNAKVEAQAAEIAALKAAK